MSFLEFFHHLLSEGIIPEKSFQVILYLKDGHIVGKHIEIGNTKAADSMFSQLDPEKVVLTSLESEYTITQNNDEWTVQEWIRKH